MGEKVLEKEHQPGQYPTEYFALQIARKNLLQEGLEKYLLWRNFFLQLLQSWLVLMKGLAQSEVQQHLLLPWSQHSTESFERGY